jgi:hypothetical protein
MAVHAGALGLADAETFTVPEAVAQASYFPVVEATLTLHSVTDCKVLDDQRIVTYMFNQCERTNTGCALVFCEAMSVVLDVPAELTGELREHELDRRGYVEEYGRFTERGIHLEGEE